MASYFEIEQCFKQNMHLNYSVAFATNDPWMKKVN